MTTRLLWPMAFIIFGGTLLLQALGAVPASLWGALVPLWPVFFIGLGLRMWFGPRAALGAVIHAAVVFLVLAGAALSARAQSPGRLQPLVQYSGGAASASVSLQLQTAQLNLSALDGDILLTDGAVLTAPGETITQVFVIEQGTGTVTFTQKLTPLFAPFIAAPDLRPRWDLRLTPAVPLALDVRALSGVLRLDLASTRLTRLDLHSGAADAVVIFPARGLTADLRSTAGDLTLTLPAGVPVRLTLSAPPGNVEFPPFFIRAGNTLTSPGFTPTGDYLDLTVVSAGGHVTVN